MKLSHLKCLAVSMFVTLSSVSATPVSAQELSKRGLERVYAVGKAYVIAQQISKQCRGEFRMKGKARSTVSQYLRDIGRREGIGSRGMRAAFERIPPARVQRDVLNYIEKRKIVINEPATWCAAGRAELRANQQIGNFLHLR